MILSKNKVEFFENLHANFDEQSISKIEEITRGQSENSLWYDYRKAVISASKVHEVKTKMKKAKTGAGGYINMFTLIQKISGNIFTSPDIPDLVYGRNMEPLSAEKFLECFKQNHKNIVMKDCVLFLHKEHQFIGASPDRIVSC